jgi:hypothetical protein
VVHAWFAPRIATRETGQLKPVPGRHASDLRFWVARPAGFEPATNGLEEPRYVPHRPTLGVRPSRSAPSGGPESPQLTRFHVTDHVTRVSRDKAPGALLGRCVGDTAIRAAVLQSGGEVHSRCPTDLDTRRPAETGEDHIRDEFGIYGVGPAGVEGCPPCLRRRRLGAAFGRRTCGGLSPRRARGFDSGSTPTLRAPR